MTTFRLLVAALAGLVLAVVVAVALPSDASRVELTPPMVCERGHVPECWIVGE